jgi:hypothetical protein
MFMAWHITAGAVAPLAMHALGLWATDAALPNASVPEVCEHHAMPGAVCPMHSEPGPDTTGNQACAMVACDSAATHLFALLAWNGLLVPPVEIAIPLVNSGRPAIPSSLLSDLSVSPTTPPPRA